MKNLPPFRLLFLGIFTALTTMITAQTLDEQQHLHDSLKKKGVPEADLPGYVKYLLNKKYHPQTPAHTHSSNKTDSTKSCYNPDFELGNLTNWSGYTGACCPVFVNNPGIVPGRHTITSGTGFDKWSQNTISEVAPAGGNFSVRLGNDNTGSEAERLVHSFLVTPQNTSFIYQYAVILQDPSHEPAEQPRFEVRVFDKNNQLIPCGYYQVTAAANIPGFVSYNDIRYKDWATVGVDLTKYVGQVVTIEFLTADCGYGGHFGYAYIDASCEPLKIKKKFCKGDSTATLTAPKGFTKYKWSTGHTTQTITILNPQKGDTIWADLTSVTGCPTKLYAVLIEETLPANISATGDTTICPGASVPLKATGGEDYTWYVLPGNTPISNLPDHIVKPLTTTEYKVSIANACGTVFDTVKVNVKPHIPIVVTPHTATICLGANLQLSASGTTTYSWSPSTGLSCTTCSNPVLTPTKSGNVIVKALDTLSTCIVSDTVKVTLDSSTVSVDAVPISPICEGSTVYLNAYVHGATSYSWSPSVGLNCTNCLNPFTTPSATTTFTFVAWNKCAADTDTVTVKVYPKPIADAGANKYLCYGDTFSLQGTGGTIYIWSPQGDLSCTNCQNPKGTATKSKTYYLSVSNPGGCVANDSVKVIIKSSFYAVTPDQTICEGTSVTLKVSGDTTNNAVIWTPSTGLSCSTCPSTVASPTSTTSYTVVGLDSTSCKGIDVITILVNKLPVADAGPDKDLCLGKYTYLTGSGGNTYKWYPPTDLSCTNCPNPQTGTKNTMKYYMVAINNCGSDTDSVVVTARPLPTVIATGDATVCAGTPTPLLASGAVNYQWSPSWTLSCSYCINPYAKTNSTTVYTVIGTDQYGCVNSDAVTVTTLALPTIEAGPNQSICIGQSATLNPTGMINLPVWSPPTNLSCTSCTTTVATPTITTTYSVTVTHAGNGCVNTDYLTITVNYPPTVFVSSPVTICKGNSTQLNASGGNSYSWSPNQNINCVNCATPTVSPQVTSTYSVIAYNNCGSDTGAVKVTVLPLPTLTVTPDVKACVDDVIPLSVTGADYYTWSPSSYLSCTFCNNPTTTPKSDIKYTISAVDINQCTASEDVVIDVDTRPNPKPTADYQLTCTGLIVEFDDEATPVAQSYTWEFGDGKTSGLKDPNYIYVDASKEYTVKLTAANGICSTTVSLITPAYIINKQLSVPNVFTPNGDGKNDCFMARTLDSTAIDVLACGTISIYDRWGLKVFEGPLNQCWNGKMKNTGAKLSNGTYYYIVELQGVKEKSFVELIND